MHILLRTECSAPPAGGSSGSSRQSCRKSVAEPQRRIGTDKQPALPRYHPLHSPGLAGCKKPETRSVRCHTSDNPLPEKEETSPARSSAGLLGTRIWRQEETLVRWRSAYLALSRSASTRQARRR